MITHSSHDSRAAHTVKSILKSLYITAGFFIFLFAIFHILGTLYVSSLASKSINNFNSGIQNDLDYLTEQGNEIAKDEFLIDRLIVEDLTALIDITKRELKARAIGLIGVANSEGIIMSRTLSKSNLGQNVFLTTTTGRIVAQEKSVQSIELRGFGNQLFMTTARPIVHEGKMIGALFANYLTDDEYAKRFRNLYLPRGTEVIFYTKEYGVYGNSFSDPEIRHLIESYFNSGSDWIQKGSSGKTISFSDHNFYIVENVVFPGLEQSPGGALIFIPRSDISSGRNIILAFLTSIFFIFFVSKRHMRSHGEEKGWHYYVFVAIILITIFFLSLSVLRLQDIGYLKLERIPYTLYNSTLRLQPDSGIYDIQFEQRFSMMVDTGDESINAVQISLIFDPEMVDVKSFEPDNSVCSYVIENQVDNSSGKANLSCVLLKVDGGRGSLKIGDVVVIPKKIGTFTLSFDKKETKVLASDGLGTDVLRMAQSGSYRVDNFDPLLIPSSSSKPFVVFSPTHPNQSRWYNNSEARFVWKGKPGAIYKYEFDSSPNTVPSNERTIQGSTATISVPGDGIFYFHLQLATGGPVDHYLVRADRTPPSILDMRLSSEDIVAGDVVRFSFESEDMGSGVQKNYYVDLGNQLFLPIGNQLSIPFLEEGDQKIILRVYDGANNYIEKSQIIHVKAD